MEYVNFNVALPVVDYLRLESKAQKLRLSKNEILIKIINSSLCNEDKGLGLEKNAGNLNFYNKN